MTTQNHPFHLVNPSPWPLLISFNLLNLLMGLISWFRLYQIDLLIFSLISMLLILFQWWRDITRESTLQGLHSLKVSSGLRWGMILFITSEILFFISFFWSFFHNSLSPNIELAMMWPPKSINTFNPMNIPLLNTLILLSSGITVTWAHHSLMENNYSQALQSLMWTIGLGIYFTLLQALEYYEASFSISDSIYGTCFFMATGFHGFHVIVGTTFLLIMMIRLFISHFSSIHHFGFEAAAWYWHFVDVVWLFLYLSIYWWSS